MDREVPAIFLHELILHWSGVQKSGGGHLASWRFSGNMVRNATLPPLFEAFDQNSYNYSSEGLDHIKQKKFQEISNSTSYGTFFYHKWLQRYDHLKIMSFFRASLWIPHRKYPDLNCPQKREKRAFNLILICFDLHKVERISNSQYESNKNLGR